MLSEASSGQLLDDLPLHSVSRNNYGNLKIMEQQFTPNRNLIPALRRSLIESSPLRPTITPKRLPQLPKRGNTFKRISCRNSTGSVLAASVSKGQRQRKAAKTISAKPMAMLVPSSVKGCKYLSPSSRVLNISPLSKKVKMIFCFILEIGVAAVGRRRRRKNGYGYSRFCAAYKFALR